MSKDAIKRIINKDIKEGHKMKLNDLGIHIHYDEENMLKARAIIFGPKDTPYENGILYFLIEFPNDYPFSPPKIGYLSSSRNRIHPNLYVGRSHDNFIGKVCLSSINTWSGPKWTTVMHIGSILLSIQSLLCKNPLHNEPGFENEVGQRNDSYNQIVEYDTYNHLILKNGFEIHPLFQVFESVIKNHLLTNKEPILNKLDELSINNPKPIKISLNIYNLFIVVDYLNTKKKLIDNFKI
jgi:ubiquitin-conjugating enzyme E2 O